MKPLFSEKDFEAFKKNILRARPIILDHLPKLKASRFKKELDATGKKRTSLTVSFLHDGKEFTQRFAFVKKRCGCIRVWYFICPSTGRLSYYTYFFNGQYRSRWAMPGALFYKQVLNTKKRERLQGRVDPLTLPQINAEKPTKTTRRALKKIEKARAFRQEYLAKYGKKRST